MRLRHLLLPLFMLAGLTAPAQDLVILHTNDTHSGIDPDSKGMGGVARRKVVIDSVRAANPNVLLIDAGDAVQGSLYFSLFKGEAERKVMNLLNYDVRILGNHEFDNGPESLAQQWQLVEGDRLSTNYDLRDTPLDSLFKPYTIKEYGGKRVGIIALNLNPQGIIAARNSQGVKYLDAAKAANAMAWYLRNVEHVDMVIAVTHIGYDGVSPYTPNDPQLVAATEGIDLIIGGHSHTVINPQAENALPSRFANAVGDTILVAQAGYGGRYIGEIKVDLAKGKPTASRLIAIDKRLDAAADPQFDILLKPYRHSIDSLKRTPIGRMAQDMPHRSPLLANWIADEMLAAARTLVNRNVDIAIANGGGIRRGLSKGTVTKEQVMTMLPFDNHLVVMEIKGSDLIPAFEVMKKRGLDSYSAPFDWKSIDPDRTYTLVTIDYLAMGGDYLTTLTHGKTLYEDPRKLDEVIMQRIASRNNRLIKATDNNVRIR